LDKKKHSVSCLAFTYDIYLPLCFVDIMVESIDCKQQSGHLTKTNSQF